jgi:hypothetical protein
VGAPINVCVDRDRTVRRRIGITVYQVARSESLCKMQLSPPQQSVEHALLSVASRKKKLDASIAVIADAVQDGRTTADRVMRALAVRPKLRHRGLFRQVLGDVGAGVRSVLEYRYLVAVERSHGLPRGQRQEPLILGGKKGYPDVEYREQNLVVHLDGRVGHTESLDRWGDFDRDITSLIELVNSIRVGWRQVLDPCRLAASVALLLQQRGWTGTVRPCGPLCTAISTPGVENAVQTG